VPTTFHYRGSMVGTLRFAHPTKPSVHQLETTPR
jgi:hypothetical protein